jgi:uncharacterized protein (DUF1330 family)
MSIEPTPEQFARMAGSDDPDPVIMINLLRFKQRADGIDAADEITGAEAYARYGAAVTKFLEKVGGRIVLALAANECLIGPLDGEWDMVLAVEYPSRSAFVAMTTDPGYLEIHGHRAAALADSRLIACKPFAP